MRQDYQSLRDLIRTQKCCSRATIPLAFGTAVETLLSFEVLQETFLALFFELPRVQFLQKLWESLVQQLSASREFCKWQELVKLLRPCATYFRFGKKARLKFYSTIFFTCVIIFYFRIDASWDKWCGSRWNWTHDFLASRHKTSLCAGIMTRSWLAWEAQV